MRHQLIGFHMASDSLFLEQVRVCEVTALDHDSPLGSAQCPHEPKASFCFSSKNQTSEGVVLEPMSLVDVEL